MSKTVKITKIFKKSPQNVIFDKKHEKILSKTPML